MSKHKWNQKPNKKERILIRDIEGPSDSQGKKEGSRENVDARENLLRGFLDDDVLIVLEATQLNILGQTFRPLFTGTVIEVTMGHITLWPVIIKMPNAPFYEFPTPLSFPLEKVVGMTRFDPEMIIPIV